MSWHLSPLGEWLAHGVLGGGVLLLVVGALASATRQPARRQRLAECGILSALLLAGLSLGPAWLTVRLPASWTASDAPPAPESLPKDGPASWPLDGDPTASADEAGAWSAPAPEVAPSWPLPVNELGGPPKATPVGRGFALSFQTVTVCLVAVYLVGVVSLLGHWLLGLLGLWRLLRTSLPAPPPVAHFFSALTPARRRPRLLMSGRLRVPVSCGILRPTVLLPAGLCTAADPVQLRWVFAHELTHLQRRDPWSCVLVGLGGSVFFWCPWYWWLRRQVRLCREYVADAAAAGQAGPAADYAQFLLGLATASAGPRLALGVLGDSSDLFRRVTMLLQAPLHVEKHCPRRWSLAVAVGLLGVAVCASGIGLRAADPASSEAAPAASAAPVDDRDPAQTDDPNQAPPRKSDELRRAEEALNKALQNLPAEVDAEKIRKEVEKALEKARRELQRLERQPGQTRELVQRLQYLNAHHSPRVGLGLQSPSAVLREQLSLPEGQGLVIVQVVPDSPAAKAGLKVNDILLEVNGKPVANDIRNIRQVFAGDKKVDVVVLRKGKKETIKGLSVPEGSDEPRPGQRFGGGLPSVPTPPRAPGGFVPGAAGAPAVPAPPAVGRFPGGPANPALPGLPGGGRFAPADPNAPAQPGAPGGMAGFGGFGVGPNTVMTTVFRNNDRFTTRHQEGSLVISVTGTVSDGKAKVGEIYIQDVGSAEKYESVDKVPQRYLDKVKNLVEMSEKGQVKVEVKTPRK